jgi:single-stranded-DNA-specific exonuclease
MFTPEIVSKSKIVIDKGFSELELLDLLLKNRGIKTSEVAKFLNPPSPKTFEPKEFKVDKKQLKLAVERIIKAKNNNENVLIYGDYDVDGITSTAVLWQVLHQSGLNVLPYIPDRENDGYGIRAASFFKFEESQNKKFNLLITVDNGIVANSEIEKINNKGTEVIIVDHHVPTDTLPKAVAYIHSTEVSGCTLAWILASQFSQSSDLGLAALGAVADCMPLNGVNRSIVVHGLQELRLNPSPGIKKLMQVSGVKQDSLSAYDLGFILGPRINAVGRLSNPTDALRLLCSHNLAQAAVYSKTLDAYNRDRQSLQQESLEIASDIVGETPNDKLIFISDPSFHPGIIGLLAGRMTEKYYLPSIAISVGDDISKGSCRSIKELNIIESLRESSQLLLELGGHTGAAGFSLKTKDIPKFKKSITKVINEKLKDQILKPSIIVDAEMKLRAVTLKNCKLIEKLEPFGIENPEPLFLFKDVVVLSKRLLGSKSEHLKLKLDDPVTKTKENIPADFANSSMAMDAIAFKKGEFDQKIKVGDRIDLIARIGVNVWNGVSTPQLLVKEIFCKD